MDILAAIIDILVDGLVGIGEGLGGALSSMAEAIFLTTTTGTGGTTTTELSTFGTLVIVFAGISLGLALTRFGLPGLYCQRWQFGTWKKSGMLKCKSERKLYFNRYNTCNA